MFVRTRQKDRWKCKRGPTRDNAAESRQNSQTARTTEYGANSSKELSGVSFVGAKSNSTLGVATAARAPSQVTEISPGLACNSFRALCPRLRRSQTGRKKAPHPQIVYLLIRENNWVKFIISRVPEQRCARVAAFVFVCFHVRASRFIRA